LYRGTAIPIVWHILPANQQGAWMGPLLRLLRQVRPAVPAHMTVLVQADCGLWSPRLWKRIRDLGWHPLLRVRQETTFAPAGQRRQRAVELVPGPGHARVGRGVAFKHRGVRRAGTLIVVWGEEHAAPWIVLTDLAPQCVGVGWYGLRIWVEIVFAQVTKADVRTGFGRGNDVADLHLLFIHDDAINQQFHQLAPLVEGRMLQTNPQPFADRLDGRDRVPHLEQLLAVVRQLAVLYLQRVALLDQFPLPPLKLRQLDGVSQIGRQQAFPLPLQAP
jgi:hypothetical protein